MVDDKIFKHSKNIVIATIFRVNYFFFFSNIKYVSRTFRTKINYTIIFEKQYIANKMIPY